MEIKDWLQGHFSKGEIKEIAKNGADARCEGLTRNRDIREFYEGFDEEIWDRLYSDASAAGMTPEDYLASLLKCDWGFNDIGFKTLLVYYTVKSYAREMTDEH